MTAHPTRFTLDRWFAQDQAVRRDEEIAKHLASCERCTQYLNKLEQQREILVLEQSPASFATQLAQKEPPRKTFSWLWAAALTTGVALGIGLFVVTRFPHSSSHAPTRWMNEGDRIAVQPYRQEPGSMHPLTDKRPREGDTLRLEVLIAEPILHYWAAVYAVEQGQVSVVLPQQGSLELERSGFLPGSIVLTDIKHPARIVVYVQRRRFSAHEVLPKLRKALQSKSSLSGVVYDQAVEARSTMPDSTEQP